MGLYPAHRTLTPSPAFPVTPVVKAFDFPQQSTRTQSPRHVHQQALSGTHKNYVRLVNCPIYSVVKYRPRELTFTYPLLQVWVLLTSESNYVRPLHDSEAPPTQYSMPAKR